MMDYIHYIVGGFVLLFSLIGALVKKEEPWEKVARELRQKKAKEQLTAKTMGKNAEKEGTRELLLRTLREMGCPVSDEQDNKLNFQYQGGHFIANVNNESPFVRMYYLGWESCSLFDSESFATLKQVINIVNSYCMVNVYYYVDKNTDTVWVNSSRDFLLIPQIPDTPNYLKQELNRFFSIHRYAHLEKDKQKKM